MSIPMSSPKNTPAKALNLRFGVRTSSSRKKTHKPIPLIRTVHQLTAFSFLASSGELALTTNTDTMTSMKIPRNSQSNIRMTSQSGRIRPGYDPVFVIIIFDRSPGNP